ncbi:MAG: phosphoribosyltransferase [Planctomycetota bacterium]|jgi:adenine/guanine phosphoribosyltransferase-like PRPP-binding protein|nr:phosphoribosyltransferase [Planctomycetota bacterium]
MDAEIKPLEIPLTLNEKGVSGKPTAYDAIMSSPEWKAAKNKYDETGKEYESVEKERGADVVVAHLWNADKSAELAKRLNGLPPLFIIMPSTSGANALVPALARRLVNDLGGSEIDGTAIANRLHSIPMKDVPREERPFVAREYVLENPDVLRQNAKGKAVVIVEDVFSSGASAKAFCDTLAEAKIQVTTVAGLLGDSRLSVEPQLVSKLQKTLQRAEIPVKGKEIAKILSRGQVETLIDDVNQVQGDRNEYAKIARDLRGILDSRLARHLGQDKWRNTEKGVEFAAGNDDSSVPVGAGISIELCSQPRGETRGENEVSELITRTVDALASERVPHFRDWQMVVKLAEERPDEWTDEHCQSVRRSLGKLDELEHKHGLDHNSDDSSLKKLTERLDQAITKIEVNLEVSRGADWGR